MNVDQQVDQALGAMNLEQKVGQLFLQAFFGTMLNPDTIRSITDLHCGGFTVTSHFRQFRRYARPGEEQEALDALSASEVTPWLIDDRRDKLCRSAYMTLPQFTKMMNRLQEIAAERPYDAPLILALDQEGDTHVDLHRGGVKQFPSQWGLARTGNPDLVYRSALAVGRQVDAVGYNLIYGPILDVVTNPASTYIGIRSFGSDPEFVSDMASAYLRGMREAGVMCCGKHYPGRGSTDVDDHHDLAPIDRSIEELNDVELLPYRRLMAEELPSIMIAHSIYPAWDTEHIASCSRAVLTDLTRKELGYDGMLITDSIVMQAVAQKYGSVAKACVQSVKAGINLILNKECGPIREEAYRLVLDAVKSGEIPEAQLDEQVAVTLRWKARYGLYGERRLRTPQDAQTVIADPALAVDARACAEAAVHIVRDERNLLPLPREGCRMLLVEQVHRAHLNCNDAWMHPGILWEYIIEKTPNVSLLEIENNPTNEDRENLLKYLPHYDMVLITHYTDRAVVGAADLINDLLERQPNVVVLANSPLPYNTPASWPTVVCTHGVLPPSLKAAADLIFGDIQSQPPAHPSSFDP